MKITRTFYNVGDALFTKEKLTIGSKSYTIMYDCGSTNEDLIKEAISDTEEIDVIFLSHYHADHIRGLQKILKSVEVKRLILPMISYPDACIAICMEKDQELLWKFFVNPQSVLEKEIPITYVYGERNQGEEEIDEIDYYLSEKPTRNIELSKGQAIKIDKDIDWICLPFNPFPFDQKKEDDFFKKLSEAVDNDKSINRSNVKDFWEEKDLQAEIREKTLEIIKYFPLKPSINATSMTLYSGPCENDIKDRLMGCLYTGDYDAKTPSSVDNILTFYSDYLDNIDVIQVPHHGSEHNNAELFYHPFKEKIAILSVKHGTSSIAGVDKTKQMLEKRHLKTYTTDFKGQEYYGNNGIIQKINKGVSIIQPFSLFLSAFLRTILVFITFCLSLHSHAQDLSVRSFNVDLSDQTANVKERLDLNKQPCGLIKVSLPLQNVVFEGDIIGNVEYSAGEYQVYVIDDTEMLTIKHDNFHALNLTLSEKVKSKRTYRLVVNVPSNHLFSEDNSSENLKKGNEFFDKGDYINALIYFKQLADNENNPAAQNKLGIMFLKAYGVQQNHEEALKYFHKAAKQGNEAAQHNLGLSYELGNGVTKDYIEAVKWYRKAAEQGYANAQRNLGFMYFKGHGVSKDYTEAVKWFREAAEQGDAKAQCNLGVCYDWGHGVTKDYTEAVKWYKKAAEQGFVGAQYNLGVSYYEGSGITKDYIEAVKWYKKAAEQGDVKAQCNLGFMYDKGYGVTKDSEKAVKWYKKAAEQGFVGGQYNLGVMYDKGYGITKDYIEAVKWYRKAAEQGLADAQCNLGFMYINGNGVPKDNTEAVKWFQKAAEQGLAIAQCNLGFMYYNGDGVTKDNTEAVKWFQKAAEQGHQRAKEQLKQLGDSN